MDENVRETSVTRALERWLLIGVIDSGFGIRLEYEKMLAANYRRFLKAGDWCIDVGAHAGMHTQGMLDVVGASGRIAIFEPAPLSMNHIRHVIEDAPNLQFFEAAAAHFCGHSSFVFARALSSESGLKPHAFSCAGADPIEITVPVTTLDVELGDWARLDYLKIDIEGGELDCLQGADCLVRRTRPIISFECSAITYVPYGKSVGDFQQYAAERGFVICDLFGEDVTAILPELTERFPVWDFFYVPAEKLDWFQSTFPRL